MTDSKRQLSEDVYAELRTIAQREMQGARRDHTLQPTALVNEAYMRLAKCGDTVWESRGQFRALATTCIRHILIDHARQRGTIKRGGDRLSITLHDLPDEQSDPHEISVLDLEEVLQELEKKDAKLARLIELRYFGGLTIPECAEELGTSVHTLKDRSRFALAWLRMRLVTPEAE
ncbi:MAG: RNA polymerase sigma factor (TIGR02999 family) [Planctomycetota bacterium]|jgi:RNA polymerase sigma factor (TIGR02999 family)